MRDYSFRGTPIAQLSIETIWDLLADGSDSIEILINDGHPYPVKRVFQRLELELLIRRLNLRQ